MEGVSTTNAIPNPNPKYHDKSIVLDIKPLRTLKPLFPDGTNQGPQFIGIPPLGTLPFGQQQQTQHTPLPSPQPLRSYRTPTGAKRGRPRGPNSKVKDKPDTHTLLTKSGITDTQREDGNKDLVKTVLTRFDAVRRRLSQLHQAKTATATAASALMSNGIRTNMKKRVGSVPGIEIGDIFFSRIEMCLVGLHMQTVSGIDYITTASSNEEPIVTSVVSAGRYDGEEASHESIIYSGQGGNVENNFNKKKKKEACDQKLERGNLALEKSLRKGNAVRVVRGVEDPATKTGRIYFYDGLYTITESWVEKGKTGCNTFKYRLIRLPNQPPVGPTRSRSGLILADISSGGESKPVPLVNDVDGDERPPAYFNYISSLHYTETFNLSSTSQAIGCLCTGSGSCTPGDLNCSCIRRNGGDLPYINGPMLVSRRPMVYECGPICPCHVKCKNKVIQTGLGVRVEVFKTVNRGWGLRSCDPIRAGTFICEYAGEVVMERADADEYVFDTSHVFNEFKWNYEPSLVDEDPSDEIPEVFDLPSPVLISAKNFGNVARFMNHGCDPNVLWQPVVVCRGNGESVVHIAFFAIRHIPPMTELTYDYGFSLTSHGKWNCLCGSVKCRGSFA